MVEKTKSWGKWHWGKCGVYVRERGGVWYLDVIKNRRHSFRSLRWEVARGAAERRSQMAALEELRAREAERLRRMEYALAGFSRGRMTLGEYARDVAGRRGSGYPVSLMARQLGLFGAEDVPICQVDSKLAEGFKEFLEGRSGLARKTARARFNAFRFVMRMAEEDGAIGANPCGKVKGISDCDVEKPALTASELSRLEAAQCRWKRGEIVKRAFLFACNTGLRVSDLKSLKWESIGSRGGNFTLRKRQVKTGSVVDVVLNRKAAGLISAGDGHSPDEFVFDGLRDVTTATLDAVIVKWAKAAGIRKRVTWHTARRTFATLLLEGGADVFTVQRLMGHSKIAMTSLYARSSDGMKARAVRALDDMLDGAGRGEDGGE